MGMASRLKKRVVKMMNTAMCYASGTDCAECQFSRPVLAEEHCLQVGQRNMTLAPFAKKWGAHVLGSFLLLRDPSGQS
jgi:hypothetical protein